MVRQVKIEEVPKRFYKIDCIGGSVYVHKHLLSECSQEWEQRLEDYKSEVDGGLSILDTTILRDPEGGKRRWELYIGFVYGNPIWTRSEEYNIEDDFLQLAIIWDDCHYNAQDRDASDAAMDAIREIVTQHADALSNPFELLNQADTFGNDDPMIFLLDFMVYGSSGSVFGKWYHAFKGRKSWIDNELAERFAEKAGLGRKGQGMPDLMEQCRYHDHRLDDDRCYLDK